MEKNYYIYVLLDQRDSGIWKFNELTFYYKPFYIGKGKGQRIKAHFYGKQLNKNTHKNNLINKIKREVGELPLHFRLFENLSEVEAFKIETEIINHFGRICDGGILTNQTYGGEGHSGYHEPKLGKRKKVYQYNLDGSFKKEWPSLTSIMESDPIKYKNVGNISTAIKRGGTCFGYIWSYEYEDNIVGRIKYQMPVKYSNIKQIDRKTDKVINIFENALMIEKELKLRDGSRNKIYECLNGKIKTAYGYKWG